VSGGAGVKGASCFFQKASATVQAGATAGATVQVSLLKGHVIAEFEPLSIP
jgi:hypothetical protein